MTTSWMACTALTLALMAALTGCDQEVSGGAGGGDGEGGEAAEGGGDGEGGEAAADPRVCTEEGAFQPCQLPGDDFNTPTGGQECVLEDDDVLRWSACEETGTAMSTPLVFVFDDAPVVFGAASGHFDLSGVASVATDWVAASTPWLVLDRDGDGAIGSGAELFGSATTLASGELASDGFRALAELDSNGDGRITPADARWSSLATWSDADQDRASASSELSPLDARGIVSIDLGYGVDRRCDARGNCEVERSTFQYLGADGQLRQGAIVDVHLRHR